MFLLVTHAIYIIIVFTAIVQSYITSSSLHPGLSRAKSNGTCTQVFCCPTPLPYQVPGRLMSCWVSACYACWFHAQNVIEYLWLAQCLCLEQSKIRQASSGRVVIIISCSKSWYGRKIAKAVKILKTTNTMGTVCLARNEKELELSMVRVTNSRILPSLSQPSVIVKSMMQTTSITF